MIVNETYTVRTELTEIKIARLRSGSKAGEKLRLSGENFEKPLQILNSLFGLLLLQYYLWYRGFFCCCSREDFT